MPITSQPELFTNSNHVSHEWEEPEGQGPVQSGGESNSQPSVFKVLTQNLIAQITTAPVQITLLE